MLYHPCVNTVEYSKSRMETACRGGSCVRCVIHVNAAKETVVLPGQLRVSVKVGNVAQLKQQQQKHSDISVKNGFKVYEKTEICGKN